MSKQGDCPVCRVSEAANPELARRQSRRQSRRQFIKMAAGSTAALVGASTLAGPLAAKEVSGSSETLVKVLYDSLKESQRKIVCFGWDHQDGENGLLRSHISNHWQITPPTIRGDFYTQEQQAIIREIFEGLLNPDWIERFHRQLKDDMGGFGSGQAIAIFGKPGQELFEFVLSGRHGTYRCDGNSVEHMAFGGPIMYGHAASGYFEKSHHPDNIFWPQALEANRLYQTLSGKEQKQALAKRAPDESLIGFRDKKDGIEGIPVAELSSDQQAHLQRVLGLLVEPFRVSDRDEVLASLKKQGGLQGCNLAFYREDDMGDDGIWDNWRLEGPAFVWHWRGAPHVHVWMNVADDPAVALNSKNRAGALRQ